MFDWFRRRLRIINPYARVTPDFSISQCVGNTALRSHIIEFLAMADLGIGDVAVENRKFSASKFVTRLPEVRQQMLKDMDDQEVTEIRFLHRAPDGRDVYLDIEDESGGTRNCSPWPARGLMCLPMVGYWLSMNWTPVCTPF